MIISKRLCEPHKRWKRARRRRKKSKRIKEVSRVAKRKEGLSLFLSVQNAWKWILCTSQEKMKREKKNKYNNALYSSIPYFSLSLPVPVPNQRMFTAVSETKASYKKLIATARLCDATRMKGDGRQEVEWRCSRWAETRSRMYINGQKTKERQHTHKKQRRRKAKRKESAPSTLRPTTFTCFEALSWYWIYEILPNCMHLRCVSCDGAKGIRPSSLGPESEWDASNNIHFFLLFVKFDQ